MVHVLAKRLHSHSEWRKKKWSVQEKCQKVKKLDCGPQEKVSLLSEIGKNTSTRRIETEIGSLS